ncbi:MAG: HD-GYP domain-containing protein [Planctomycetaceae bacterium]
MTINTLHRELASDEHLISLNEALQTVCNAFSSRFEIWEKNDRWQLTAESSPAINDDFNVSTLASEFERSYDDSRPVVLPLDDERHTVVIPLYMDMDEDAGVPTVAVGIVECRDHALLCRLARTTQELHVERQRNGDSAAEMEQYIRQVNNDFEELAWLRNLAQHLEYAEVDQSLRSVTDLVLPSLRQLIHVESLLFYPVHNSDHNKTSKQQIGTPLIYGHQDVNHDECRLIIDRYHHESFKRPIVYNKTFDNPYVYEHYLVDSFALVPVAKAKYSVGYLLALNKNSSDRHRRVNSADTDRSTPAKYGGSETTFGTIEVGLMQEAGILLAIHDRNRYLFKEQESLIVGIIRAMINAIDAKDPYTCGHSDRVALMSKRLAHQLGLDPLFCERIYMTGLLHDVGKIGIPDAVLQKPGRLSDEEYDIIKRHPQIGYDILKHLKQLNYVLPGVLHHHESVDGSGYPHGLIGDDIPLEGRIIAVVDAYDAMTSTRAYRPSMPLEKAESILQSNSGTQWDAVIVKAFFAALNDMHDICLRERSATRQLFCTEAENGEFDMNDSIASAVLIGHQD